MALDIDIPSIIGSITESAILEHMLSNKEEGAGSNVAEVMGDPFPIVNMELPFNEISRYINRKTPAVVTQDASGKWHIVTKYDIIRAL